MNFRSLALAAFAAAMLPLPANAVEIKTFRDCKNVTDALRDKQIKEKATLTKEFVEKTGPLANKMMELCADAKYAEADVARKDLEKVTGPIAVGASPGPAGAPKK